MKLLLGVVVGSFIICLQGILSLALQASTSKPLSERNKERKLRMRGFQGFQKPEEIQVQPKRSTTEGSKPKAATEAATATTEAEDAEDALRWHFMNDKPKQDAAKNLMNFGKTIKDQFAELEKYMMNPELNTRLTQFAKSGKTIKDQFASVFPSTLKAMGATEKGIEDLTRRMNQQQ